MNSLESMKEILMGQVNAQLGRISEVDCNELGAAIDMIKDLAEANYYCTVTKAMEHKEEEPQSNNYYYTERYMPYYDRDRDMDKISGRMYYTGGGNSNGSNSSSNGSNSYSNGSTMNYSEYEYPLNLHDRREGRSPMSRKMYMESKEMHHDKGKQIKELEKYMQELTTDITEMMENSSPEERQLLQKKLEGLSTKIEQMK